jgi:hypothetical protein
MKKLSLAEWASIGELMATLAVFVSLVFVVLSINQNTSAIQGSTENILFERSAEAHQLVLSDATLAAILAKKEEDPAAELDGADAMRFLKWQLLHLDIWAMAYNRHERELLGTDEWEAWDQYFVQLFSAKAERVSRDQWSSLAFGFDADFWEHVGESLFSG